MREEIRRRYMHEKWKNLQVGKRPNQTSLVVVAMFVMIVDVVVILVGQ